MGSSPHHNNTIDALRVLSILAVLLIHATTRHLETVNFNLPPHLFTLFLNQVTRFAVPLFFLISGYVLELNYQPNYLLYLKKRISRLFLPYLFWSALYYFFIYTRHSVSFLSALLTGDSSYQLYFIPTLLLFYLIFPFFHRTIKIPQINYLLMALFILEMFILNYDYQHLTINIPYLLAVAAFNIFPFVLGMHLSHKSHKFPYYQWLVLFIPVNLYMIFHEGLEGYLKTYNIHYFYSQWRPTVLIYTLAIFTFLYALLNKYSKYTACFKVFSQLSFFVFFIHTFVLELIWRFLGVFIYQYPGFDLFFFSLIASVSFSIAYLAHKIPLLPRLTG